MYNKRFQQLNEPLQADEALIQDTLRRAERRMTWRRSQGWRMAAAMAAVLFLMVAATFFTQPAPRDMIASNGEITPGTAGFTPLASAPAAQNSFDMDGMTVTLLSAITDSRQTEITIEVQGERVTSTMLMEITLSVSGTDASLRFLLLPYTCTEEGKRATFQLLLSNELKYGDGSSYIIQPDDTLRVTVSSYTHRHMGMTNWKPDWASLDGTWLLDSNPDKWGQIASAEPVFTICRNFEIAAAGMAEDGVHIVTRYRYDPDEVNFEQSTFAPGSATASLSLVDLSDQMGAVNIPGSSVAHKILAEELLYYQEFIYPLSALEMMRYGFYANVSFQYAPQLREDWSLVFPLLTIRRATTANTYVSNPTTSPVASAAASSAADELLLMYVPDLAEAFVPVGLRTEHDGITFEVISVCLKDGKPYILCSYTGNQIDKNTTAHIQLDSKLFSQYTIAGSYDEASQVRYHLTLPSRGVKMQPGDTLDISLHHIELTPSYTYTRHDQLDLAAQSDHPLTQIVEASSMTYPEGYPFDVSAPIIAGKPLPTTVLSPGEPLLSFSDGMTISAAGIIGGKLHVQTCVPRVEISYEYIGQSGTTLDSRHLSLSVMPRAAEEYSQEYLDLVQTVISWTDEANSCFYAEYVLRIDPSELKDYVLRSISRGTGELIDGEWSLSFPIPTP